MGAPGSGTPGTLGPLRGRASLPPVGVTDSPRRLLPLYFFPSPASPLLIPASLLKSQLVFVFCFYGSINESRARFDLIFVVIVIFSSLFFSTRLLTRPQNLNRTGPSPARPRGSPRAQGQGQRPLRWGSVGVRGGGGSCPESSGCSPVLHAV